MLKIVGFGIPINNLTLSRIPIFVIGVIAGGYYIRGLKFPQYTTRIIEFVSVIGIIIMIYAVSHYSHEYLWPKMIYWLPFTIIIPGVCIIMSKIIDCIPEIIGCVLSFLGGISLEIYLTHLLFLKSYINLIAESEILNSTILSWMSGIGFILFSIMCGYIMSKGLKLVTSGLNCVRKQVKTPTNDLK